MNKKIPYYHLMKSVSVMKLMVHYQPSPLQKEGNKANLKLK